MVPGWDIREQLLKDNPGTMMTWSPRHQNWVIASTMTDKLNLSKKWGVILIGTDGKFPRYKDDPEYRELNVDSQLVCLLKSKRLNVNSCGGGENLQIFSPPHKHFIFIPKIIKNI